MRKIAAILFALGLLLAACSSGGDTAATADAEVDTNSETTGEVSSEEENAVETEEEAVEVTTTAPEVTTTTVAAETTTTAAAAPVATERSLVPDCSAVGQVAVGLQTGTLTSGGAEYDYQWTVPSSYTGEPIPVVLDFHGIGSNGSQQAVFSGWAAAAEANGFLSIQPTGLSVAGDDRASWELPQFDLPTRDDVAMVVDLLDLAAASICIDPARVYATGMSNGGFFTSELVCDLSDRIAAAMSVAGVTHDESCAPTRAVPYIAFHGIDDTTVPFAGGGESDLAGAGGSNAFFEQVMPDEFAEFAADFGCTGSTDNAVTAEITQTSYSGCNDDAELSFYAIAGAGHTWPGSIISSAIASLGVTNLDIDATAVGWEFFSRHSLSAE